MEKYELPYNNYEDQSIASARTTILEKSEDNERPLLENQEDSLEIVKEKRRIIEKKIVFEKKRSLADLMREIDEFTSDIESQRSQTYNLT